MEDSKPVYTPMVTGCNLSSNDELAAVHQPTYRSMIGSLLYLTGTRPDIMHAVGIVGRFQANPKESHLQVVKIIFKYLRYPLVKTGHLAIILPPTKLFRSAPNIQNVFPDLLYWHFCTSRIPPKPLYGASSSPVEASLNAATGHFRKPNQPHSEQTHTSSNSVLN